MIYRDGSDKADQMIPYTTFQSENPDDLWKWKSYPWVVAFAFRPPTWRMVAAYGIGTISTV